MAAPKNPGTSDTVEILKIEDKLCFALYSTSRAITKQYAVILSGLGITYPQYLAMLVLWQQDGLLIQNIATKLELDGATITPLIKRLEKLGLVSRERSTSDQRKVHVFLTDIGKALREKALAIPQELSCRIGITAETAEALIQETSAIKDFISAETK